MRLIPLGSGSAGNSTYVELAGLRLLVDAGLSARQLKLRLEAIGVAPVQLDAILLSHEHSDHAQGAERFSKRHGVPLICATETLDALDRSPQDFADWLPLPPSGPFAFGDVEIDSFPVPHDAARPLGFVLRGEGLRIGFALDLGHVTTLVVQSLKGCDALVVESNYDRAMLFDGPYPWQLKQRVSSRFGHLSNDEAASLLRQVVSDNCRGVVLAHLSEKNNTPALARQTASRSLAAAGASRVEMRVARAKQPTAPLEL